MNSAIETYKVFSDFYDLYVGKFDSDFDFYKNYCNKSDKVLEIGCGTGRILDVLLKRGCNVTGVDISQEMLDKVRLKFDKQIKEERLKIFKHDFTSSRINESFDKILLTFYTFNYILDRPIDFLKNVYNSLNDNGILLMDMFYPNSMFDKSINNKWLVKEDNINGNLIRIKDCRSMHNDIEHRQQIYIINGTETKINTRRKYFTPLVLKEIIKSSGFKDANFSYGYDYKGFKDIIDETKLKNNFIVKIKK